MAMAETTIRRGPWKGVGKLPTEQDTGQMDACLYFPSRSWAVVVSPPSLTAPNIILFDLIFHRTFEMDVVSIRYFLHEGWGEKFFIRKRKMRLSIQFVETRKNDGNNIKRGEITSRINWKSRYNVLSRQASAAVLIPRGKRIRTSTYSVRSGPPFNPFCPRTRTRFVLSPLTILAVGAMSKFRGGKRYLDRYGNRVFVFASEFTVSREDMIAKARRTRREAKGGGGGVRNEGGFFFRWGRLSRWRAGGRSHAHFFFLLYWRLHPDRRMLSRGLGGARNHGRRFGGGLTLHPIAILSSLAAIIRRSLGQQCVHWNGERGAVLSLNWIRMILWSWRVCIKTGGVVLWAFRHSRMGPREIVGGTLFMGIFCFSFLFVVGPSFGARCGGSRWRIPPLFCAKAAFGWGQRAILGVRQKSCGFALDGF